MSLLDSLWVTKNAITGAFEAVKNEASQLAGNLLLPKNKKSMAFPVDASQPVLNKPFNNGIVNSLSEMPTNAQDIANLASRSRALFTNQQAQQADTLAKKENITPQFAMGRVMSQNAVMGSIGGESGVVKGLAKPVIKKAETTVLSKLDPLIQEAKKYKSAEEFWDWINVFKKHKIVDGKKIGDDYAELKPLVSKRKTSDFLGYGEYKFDEGILKGKIGAGEKLTDGKVNHWKERISKGERPIIIIEDKPYISKITDNLQGGREYDAILEARVRQGHSRLEAYKQLGIKEVPVFYKSQLTDIWKKAHGYSQIGGLVAGGAIAGSTIAGGLASKLLPKKDTSKDLFIQGDVPSRLPENQNADDNTEIMNRIGTMKFSGGGTTLQRYSRSTEQRIGKDKKNSLR
jgi:hypothetical protein